ncbi:LysR family transcriptional regulator [Vibrio sp. SCSIO 43140]|uniref:LysR family transcriptional regulator n=1 Tax=Vibrio sp. SCSIO 43140 TaxID=2819100 RepID=UPI00207529F0|nr:LysR family transcriptional regulator [Vibrio sp. SCSIO 43140]USD61755.1 LysR family transcriptional regulator [Vibrio sp. SCSIO 43140]
MKLQFESLITFVAVVDTGSFSSAARKMGKSQSTVSTAVQNLESDLGFLLFVRANGKVSLTEKGKRFFHLSTPLVSRYRDLLGIAEQMSSSENTVFRIGIDPLVFNENVKKTLFDFSEAFPNIDLVVVTKPSFVLSNYISEGKIDLALGNPYHKTNNEFNTDELYKVNCWWVGHPELVHGIDCNQWRVLLMDGFDELLNLSDIALRCSWRFDDLSTIVDLCAEKKGISFLPEHIIKPLADKNKLVTITNNTEFFGRKVVASLFWPVHSEFGLYNQWIKNKLKTAVGVQRSFVADLAN